MVGRCRLALCTPVLKAPMERESERETLPLVRGDTRLLPSLASVKAPMVSALENIMLINSFQLLL